MDSFQNKTGQISFKNVQLTSCRTCMGRSEVPRNLCDAESRPLLDLLNCLLGFELKLINDEYIICSTCEVLLKQLAEFKNTCLKSHEQFCSSECKKEDVLVDRDIRIYLETALESENESVNQPASPKINNSSDTNVARSSNRKQINKRKIEKSSTNGFNTKSKESIADKNPSRKGKPFVLEQFSSSEVLQAIQECNRYISDLKYRTCLLCDFTGSDNKSLALHMKFMHDVFFKAWCFRCNLLDYDLQTHKETLKCCDYVCKFCDKDFKLHSRLVEHLRYHCNRTYNELESTNLKKDSDNLEEENRNSSNIGDTKEEIILLKGTIESELQNDYEGKIVDVASLSDSNDSDSKPLILRIRSTRRYSKRSTRKINRPSRYKDSHEESKDKNLNNVKSHLQTDNMIEQNHKADNTDPDYVDGSNIDVESKFDGGTKGRMKCRLKQFDHEEVLQAINDTIKPFKMNRECVVCSFVASHARALSVHMTLLHKDIKDNWCSRCNCIVDHLAEHAESHRNDLLKCTFCGRSFNKFFHLKEHLKSHSRLHAYDLESKWYSCTVCPNSYPDEQKLKQHECNGPDPSFTSRKKKKIKDSRFCVPCNKRVRSLPIHIKHKHNADGELKEPSNKLCSVCGKSFSDNSKLTVHMRIHTGECPYKCSYCDKRCSTRNHLVVHERTHTGEKPHICYICGKAFAQSSVLGTHMKIHTGRPEQCSVCDQRFCRPAELKLHMRRHTGEKPYLCNNCGLSFHQRSHLVEHVKRHSNERPYKCSFCEKGFKQISVLKAHENIHTGLKPYKCTQCPYSCRQSYSLTVHMKQHANDAPQPERPHKCLICCKHFSTHSMLMSHANNMHSEIVESEKEFNRIETVMDCS